MEIDSAVKASASMFSMRNGGFPMRDQEKVPVTESTVMGNKFGVRYEVGDMVWGKIKSLPWWPGQIFDEALALPIVSETKRDGHLLVAFFGDDTYGWLDPIKLIPFELNYKEKSRQSKASAFVDAVQDAENEIRRRAALGLSCRCQHPSNFKAIGAKGFFEVDVEGYAGAAVYTGKQIESARNGFQPTEMLCFLKGLALMPCCKMKGLNCLKNVAIVLAYRKATFEEFDQTLPSQVGSQGTDISRNLDLQEKLPFEVSLSCHPEAPSRTKCSSRPTEAERKRNLNQWDISSVLSDQGPESFSTLSLHKKEHAVVSDAMVSEFPCQQKFTTKRFGGTSMTSSQDGAANEATTINRKPVLGKISSHTLMVDWEHSPRALAALGDLENLPASGNTLPPSDVPSHAKVLVTGCGHMDEQPKVSNPFIEELTCKQAVTVEKRKRKTEVKLDTILEHSYKRLKSMKVEKSDGSRKSYQTGLNFRDDNLYGDQGRKNGAFYAKYEVPQLLDNLLDFALNHFHGVGMEHNALAAFLQFFQQFRSSKFLKNFVAFPSTGFELMENNHPESFACNMTLKSPSHVDSQEIPSASKPPKKRIRPDNYEMLKEGMHVKQLMKLSKVKSLSAENVKKLMKLSKVKSLSAENVKKLMKLSKVKSLSAEKKVNYPKALESLAIHEKGAVKDPTKQGKNLIKKHKTSREAAERTMLVIVFPLQSAMPSVSELKARFARFGPLDSVPRLFWKSSTCRIVFKYKSDAHVAYRYVSRGKYLFGDAKLDCYLEALEVQGSKLLNPGKHQVQEDLDKFRWSARTETGDHTEKLTSASHEHLSDSVFQPKSCLKKSRSDEFGTGALRIKPRVRFKLDGNQSSSGEKMIVNGGLKNSNVIQTIGSSSLSCNSTAEIPGNWQVAQSSPALHPLMEQITYALQNYGLDHFVATCNARYEAEVRKNIYSTPNSFNVDVSSQMLNLMTRCSEIVSDLRCWLGYVPIHL